MIFNVVLYDEHSTIRVANRANNLLASCKHYRTTKDTIWVDGLYMRFSPKLIIINIFDQTKCPEETIFNYLSCILCDEEVFITDGSKAKHYISSVKPSTTFDKFLIYQEV